VRHGSAPRGGAVGRKALPTIHADARRHFLTAVTPVAIAAAIALAVAVVVLAAAVGAVVATLVLRRTQRAAAAVAASVGDPATATPAEPTSAAAETEADHESFGYIVSHDLRAPIRVVEGFTKIVKEDYGAVLDKVGHDHLDRILGAAARMNSMIDALLGLSRLSSQPIARVPVNLSQIAAFVIDELRRQQPEREVEVEIEPALLTSGDPTLLRMMLENLLGNAWKYSGNARPARIGLMRHDGDATTFTVHDNGAGFDMRFADRLFGVFQRLHSASEFPGTGIGLASVRRIVRRHHGQIWAESEPDRGARFHFSLPLGPPRH
jgi:light-regulated signal transduction histidine kinase (bacteriophytochrome)